MPRVELVRITGLMDSELDSAGARFFTATQRPDLRLSLQQRMLGHILTRHEVGIDESRQQLRLLRDKMEKRKLAAYLLLQTTRVSPHTTSRTFIGALEAQPGLELRKQYTLPLPLTSKRLMLTTHEINDPRLGMHISGWTSPKFDPHGHALEAAYSIASQIAPVPTAVWTIEPVRSEAGALQYALDDMLMHAGYETSYDGFYCAKGDDTELHTNKTAVYVATGMGRHKAYADILDSVGSTT